MLVIKLVVLSLVVIICSLIGINKARKYETREYILRESIELFKGIENEIKYTLATIPNAIETVRLNMKTKLKDVMGIVSFEMLKYNVKEESIANEIGSLNELTLYDKQIITNGIIKLGSSDVEGQIGIIEMTCNNLKTQLSDSIEEKKKNSRIYRTVGIATGLIIAIVLI